MPESVAVVGDYVVYGSGTALVVVEFSSADSRVVSTLDVGGVIWHMEALGNHLYTAVGEGTYQGLNSIRLFDLSEPTAPKEIAMTGLEGEVTALTISGNLLAASFEGDENTDPYVIELFDVSLPASPELLGSIEGLGAWDMALQGTELFLASGGLVTVDISDPSHPEVVGGFSYPTTPFGLDESFSRLVANTSHVFAITALSRDLVVLDTSNLAEPVVIGTLDNDGGFGFFDLAWGADFLIVSAATGGLRVVDVSDPEAPEIAGSLDEGYDMRLIAVSGDRVFGTSFNPPGIRAVDIGSPSDPVGFAQIKTPGGLDALAFDGAHVFGIDGWALWVIDMNDPAQPHQVGAWHSSCRLMNVAAEGELVFVLSWRNCDEDASTLSIINVSNPSAPTRVGKIALPGTLHDVAYSDTHVFVTTFSGLYAIDVSNPADPRQVDFLETEGRAYQLVILGQHAFVGKGKEGLSVIDVTNPKRLQQVGEWHGSDSVWDIAGEDDILVVRSAQNGRQSWILDVSIPDQPVDIGAMYDAVYDPVLLGNRLYTDQNVIRVYDMTFPSSPVHLETLGFTGHPSAMVGYGSTLVVSTDQAGVAVFQGCHLIANFTYGKDGRSVQFYDDSVGDPTAWLWDFGDGSTSVEQHPNHNYESGWRHRVSLTVTNDDGQHTSSKLVMLISGGGESDRLVVD